MQQRGVVHPDLVERLRANHLPDTCTIQQATETLDGYGQPSATWSDVTGLAGLPCRLAPWSQDQERRLPEMVQTQATHVAAMGYAATITTRMRAVIGGVGYDIVAVRHDGNEATTWLGLEVISG
jgi:head-tail adaptor